MIDKKYKIMTEIVNRFPPLEEVPIIEGQSEDICGQDDRYYAFGLWTDYCGLSKEEMKKAAIANAAGSSECCGGGGGGQSGDTGSTKTVNVVTITLKQDGNSWVVVATPNKPVDEDVEVSVEVVTNMGAIPVAFTLKKGVSSAKSDPISLSVGEEVLKVSTESINLEPKETEEYELKPKNNTGSGSTTGEYAIYGLAKYIDVRDLGIEAITDEVMDEMKFIKITDEFTVDAFHYGEVDESYRSPAQTGIAINYSYAFVLLVDTDIDLEKLKIMDIQNTISETGEEVKFDNLGTITTDFVEAGKPETYFALVQPFASDADAIGYSTVLSRGEDPEDEDNGVNWKYKITK